MVPPRTALVLNRIASLRLGLFSRQFSAYTLRTPPDISLPMVSPPCPSFISQLRMTRFSLGTPTRRPSRFRPDLIAMQSSPVSNTQFSIRTSRDESGSHPSLFGPWLLILMLRTVTFVHSTGFTSNIGELIIVTPSMSTFLEWQNWTRHGRR